ncbi:agmatine deiminase family protein [Streptomyces sp. A7024]|uniref:Agmatine deiminase family protein n=1 Tax=Streptomyces coryli TaxID=1128680 RepID=A0A6G4U049_9ACTN|nr:agmatine deiminase family protein [Streptomyces coryli]NGN65605.1 agmatine deiminase family protein [Streptomyces coryli]
MVLHRRKMLQTGALAALGGLLSACGRKEPDQARDEAERAAPAAATAAAGMRMPEEREPHERTFMAWPTRGIWGPDVDGVRDDIAGIARAIAEFEPVTLLANQADAKAARKACGSGVEVLPAAVDDLWMRDTGPSFVRGPEGGMAGVDLNFNGWGNKQPHRHDATVARAVLDHADIRRIKAPITGEGGALEVDGAGTLLATESSWVNRNRNPGKSRDDIEKALQNLFGVTEVIWVKGVKGKDITDYHIDALARFSEPGVVVMSKPADGAPKDVWRRAYDQARAVLSDAVDADGKRLEIVDLPEPGHLTGHSEEFLASYVNYYVVNDGVILPRFGDRRADRDAAAILRDLYPGREVVQLPVDTLGEGGGGIHCATQQQPK